MLFRSQSVMGFRSAALGITALAAVLRADAAGIERHFDDPPGHILQTVELPAGTESVLLSGIVADPIPGKTGDTVEDYGDTQTQSRSTLKKIEAVLHKRGYQLQDVVKLTVFLVGDPHNGGKLDFAGFNRAFDEFFKTAQNPNSVVRSTVQVVALAHPPLLVEIEATAARVRRRPAK